MQLDTLTQQSYNELSQQAALFERQKQWSAAAEYWQHAEEKAKNGDNKKWAVCRKAFCINRSYYSQKSTKRPNVIVI
ncbi:ANR family transcriptional regulator [Vibrio sp. M250220]|uniref:ANR family transcriptional regulator n=1 Tax=Vibrio sp. M250220 TaxID=3020894 RepID=UPI002F4050DD